MYGMGCRIFLHREPRPTRNGNTPFLLALNIKAISKNCQQELCLEAALSEDIFHPGASNA
jgi:hypothetical protein